MNETLNNILQIVIAGWVLWLLKKYWPDILLQIRKARIKVLPLSFNIGISLKYKPGELSEEYFEEIMRQIQILIENQSLEDSMKIHNFSKEITFATKKEAEKFRSQKDVDLIIWGSFSGDSLKSKGRKINELDIKYTYGYPKDRDNKVGKYLSEDFARKIPYKSYSKIIEEESLDNIIKISNNTLDISMYVLSHVFLLWGNIDQALEFARKVYSNNSTHPEFQTEMQPYLSDLLWLQIVGIRNKREIEYEKIILLSREMLELNPRDPRGLTHLGVALYKTQQEKEAEQVIGKLQKVYPNKPITYVNVAFIRLKQGKYKSAVKQYQKLLHTTQAKGLIFNSTEVVEFLEEEYNREGDCVYKFASGLILYHLVGDKDLGKRDLQTFINQADVVRHKKMYRWAKRIINSKD